MQTNSNINTRTTAFIFFLILVLTLLFCEKNVAQCVAGFNSITSTGNSQKIHDTDISISSPTNAQSTRITYESVRGYYIGDENYTEEILFTLSKPVTTIRITARALTAVLRYSQIEYFSLEVNGIYYKIQPSELVIPDPLSGSKCILQANGAILGDTTDGDGSFIYTYTAPNNSFGITSFKIKDSVVSQKPEGVILDVQIYSNCVADTIPGSGSTGGSFFIPNAFTPNQDGKNDLFKPLISGNLRQYEFTIFNRWGQMVFHSKDFIRGWDGQTAGKEQGNNVFVWQCSYRFEGDLNRRQKGTVMLIR